MKLDGGSGVGEVMGRLDEGGGGGVRNVQASILVSRRNWMGCLALLFYYSNIPSLPRTCSL